jgi:hypothetical protein
VLGEVAGKADQLARQGDGAAQPGIGRVEPGLAQTAAAGFRAVHDPDRLGE